MNRSRHKISRRLTSDPIRTSLGLLPSGPDPVGEWLVHRQSPGPYLGPKRWESKRTPTGPDTARADFQRHLASREKRVCPHFLKCKKALVWLAPITPVSNVLILVAPPAARKRHHQHR